MKLFILSAAAFGALCVSGQDNIRLNEIQVIGTHNSYHAGIAPNEAKLMAQRNQRIFDSLDYHHAPLADQLSSGVRQIELDVFADTKGGLYANPLGPKMVLKAGLPVDPPYQYAAAMTKPGFKVLHVQDLDYRSTCPTFVQCLDVVKTWSKAHPGHIPIFILVETKQSLPKSELPLAVPEHFTGTMFDLLDAEIRSVFTESEMITPDQVRGKYQTVNESISHDGWPTLAASRGKVIFLMDQRPMGPIYTEGHPSLRGRLIFTNAIPGTPDAAFTEQNDGAPEEIARLVKEGYLVRTRSDSETKQGRTGDTTRRDAALRSGAQLVSTDYPASEPATWSGYSVSLPGGTVARCNPIMKPKGCNDAKLEPKN